VASLLDTAVAAWRASDYDEANDRYTDVTGNALHLTPGTPAPERFDTDGGRVYIDLPEGSSNRLTTPFSGALDITAEIDARAYLHTTSMKGGCQWRSLRSERLT
jgi:hypothetical protein